MLFETIWTDKFWSDVKKFISFEFSDKNELFLHEMEWACKMFCGNLLFSLCHGNNLFSLQSETLEGYKKYFHDIVGYVFSVASSAFIEASWGKRCKVTLAFLLFQILCGRGSHFEHNDWSRESNLHWRALGHGLVKDCCGATNSFSKLRLRICKGK